MLKRLLRRATAVAGCVLLLATTSYADQWGCYEGDTAVAIGYYQSVSYPEFTVQYVICQDSEVPTLYYTGVLIFY
jgi:hypothetical protein